MSHTMELPLESYPKMTTDSHSSRGLPALALSGQAPAEPNLHEQNLHEQNLHEQATQIMASVAGKRIGLLGFTAAQVTELSEAYEAVHGFCRVLEAATVSPNSPDLDDFDLLVVHISENLSGSGWLDEGLAQKRKPLIMIISFEFLLEHIPLVHQHAADFMTSPWRVEEVIFRSCSVLFKSRDKTATDIPPRQASVLITDADPSTSVLVKTVLQRCDMQCAVVDDGKALQIAREMKPHVAILDVTMPHFAGFKLLSALKGDPSTANIGVIMLTECQRESDIIRGFGLGADDYIVKPFNPMELVARVQRLLRK